MYVGQKILNWNSTQKYVKFINLKWLDTDESDTEGKETNTEDEDEVIPVEYDDIAGSVDSVNSEDLDDSDDYISQEEAERQLNISMNLLFLTQPLQIIQFEPPQPTTIRSVTVNCIFCLRQFKKMALQII